jgi:hypothetical protein
MVWGLTCAVQQHPWPHSLDASPLTRCDNRNTADNATCPWVGKNHPQVKPWAYNKTHSLPVTNTQRIEVKNRLQCRETKHGLTRWAERVSISTTLQ